MVTKEFAVKIDTELSELHDKVWKNNSDYLALVDEFKWAEKYNRAERCKEIQLKQLELQEKRSILKDKIRELDVIYFQDPWNRAFLVVSSDGHVHKTLDCSTCFSTTRYAWLVQYSNDDENTIVEDAGQDACTVCYPSAPAEVLNRPSRIVTADKVAKEKARAERETKKAEKIAKEKANAPTLSGEFIYIKDGKYTEVIRTERTAVTEWFNQYGNSQRKVVTQYFNNEPHSEESIQHQKERIARAGEIAQLICFNLAEKHGITYEEQEAILIKKYGKRDY
jgi:hypothetical protein